MFESVAGWSWSPVFGWVFKAVRNERQDLVLGVLGGFCCSVVGPLCFWFREQCGQVVFDSVGVGPGGRGGGVCGVLVRGRRLVGGWVLVGS